MMLTAIIYIVASAACSLFLLSRNLEAGGRWSVLLLYWLFACAVPLLFVFAYPRFLFSDSTPQNRRKYAAVLHGLGAVAATAFFPVLAVPFWKNPVRDLGESITLIVVLLSVLVLFLVVAVFLLLRSRSSFVILASLLFWPYWFLLALVNTGRFFEATSLQAVFYFLCFVSAVLFAFAAGTIPYRPAFAHATALAGSMSALWIHSKAMTDSGLGNVWLVFNVPDNDLGAYPRLYAQVTIAIVGLIALAVLTAGLRLLPSQWRFRRTPLRERTWPAVAASIVVLAIWFSQSVLPYRIPGAVDYSDYPVLQILHVEKRGLQFHERCFSVYWQRPYRPISVAFTGSDRRLFQYRFQHNGSSLQVPKALVERIQALLESSAHQKRQQDIVRPIWNWNSDRWYFSGQGFGLRAYSASNGSNPPQEVVDLFRELDGTPRYSETHSELKDVCLGFCYDPLSAMGWLYSNHRCFNAGRGLVCR
jgi:hypothetical protein